MMGFRFLFLTTAVFLIFSTPCQAEVVQGDDFGDSLFTNQAPSALSDIPEDTGSTDIMAEEASFLNSIAPAAGGEPGLLEEGWTPDPQAGQKNESESNPASEAYQAD